MTEEEKKKQEEENKKQEEKKEQDDVYKLVEDIAADRDKYKALYEKERSAHAATLRNKLLNGGESEDEDEDEDEDGKIIKKIKEKIFKKENKK